jgi:ABC-type oligopeptide transport system substrate-binding subunit
LLPDLDNAARGEWDLALVNWAPDWYSRNNGRSVISPAYDGRNLHGLSMNYGGYDSAATNAAIDQALAATGIEAADAAWQRAATQVIDDVGVIPLIEAKRGMLRSTRVRNCLWYSLSDSCDLASLWLVDAGGSTSGQHP